MPGVQSIPALAQRLLLERAADAALDLARLVDADCFTELVARSGVVGRMTTEVFDLLADAYDQVKAEQSIASLPEADPKEGL